MHYGHSTCTTMAIAHVLWKYPVSARHVLWTTYTYLAVLGEPAPPCHPIWFLNPNCKNPSSAAWFGKNDCHGNATFPSRQFLFCLPSQLVLNIFECMSVMLESLEAYQTTCFTGRAQVCLMSLTNSAKLPAPTCKRKRTMIINRHARHQLCVKWF